MVSFTSLREKKGRRRGKNDVRNITHRDSSFTPGPLTSPRLKFLKDMNVVFEVWALQQIYTKQDGWELNFSKRLTRRGQQCWEVHRYTLHTLTTLCAVRVMGRKDRRRKGIKREKEKESRVSEGVKRWREMNDERAEAEWRRSMKGRLKGWYKEVKLAD